MPRAYRPRIATAARASVVARRLGATGWHLSRPGPHRSGPITVTLWRDRAYVRLTLAEAERMAAENRTPNWY